MKSTHGLLVSALVLGATMLAGAPALGASHSWRVNELFSNSSGTIQFIELKEINGNGAEHALSGKSVESLSTGSIFNFPGSISGNTANRHLLLGTTGFAALPGAPTPDYTIADGFFDISSDTVRYNPYHSFPFGVAALPTDGANSIQVTNYTTNAFTTGTNSPTNYAGETGSVDAGSNSVPAVPAWGTITLMVVTLAMGLGLIHRRRSERFRS